jgi:hypothetical protein
VKLKHPWQKCKNYRFLEFLGYFEEVKSTFTVFHGGQTSLTKREIGQETAPRLKYQFSKEQQRKTQVSIIIIVAL